MTREKNCDMMANVSGFVRCNRKLHLYQLKNKWNKRRKNADTVFADLSPGLFGGND